MRAGALRQRLQLQAPPTVPDGMGGVVATAPWTVVATIWAQVAPAGGKEQLQAGQVTAIITHEVITRYRAGVLPKMRLVRPIGGQTYEIHAVTNVDLRNRQMTLACSELQTVGA